MAERAGGVYARMDGRPYTRVSNKKPRKAYVKGVPHNRIHNFESGTKRNDYTAELILRAQRDVQIKHNALEAARVAVTKTLSPLGKEYFMKIRTYPHHVLRENPLATGAGADRFSTGMSKAFGKIVGRSARVTKNQAIISVNVKKDQIILAKNALRKASMKLPIKCRTEINELAENSKTVASK
ncbi:MAG: 50S ribosomal protein L16 [archaeon]|jgi:large subunit ribosomal protein L10e|nr:50S ribosomal protein L16 [Euryarchaeota archaeon]MDP6704346.1 50S ribosomal protein L16 [archaeon]MDP7260745.1 50S ribosomal protein L16 [archaeon]HIK01026.1 50S ribosomal protein L16 [Candidatus Undinarchaeales archaeon ERR594346 U_76725]|tara:strand:+ start:39673 stop:40221 length:549 start_codon:yes stop_codon:yes gene_type:complete